MEEKERLPVHRNGGRVFAYADEIDRWQASREILVSEPPANEERPPEVIQPTTEQRKRPRMTWVAVFGTALLGGGGWWLFSNGVAPKAKSTELPPIVESSQLSISNS